MATLQDALLDEVGGALASLSEDVDGRLREVSAQHERHASRQEEGLESVRTTMSRFAAEIDRARSDHDTLRRNLLDRLELATERATKEADARYEKLTEAAREDTRAQVELLEDATRDLGTFETLLAEHGERIGVFEEFLNAARERLDALEKASADEREDGKARTQSMEALREGLSERIEAFMEETSERRELFEKGIDEIFTARLETLSRRLEESENETRLLRKATHEDSEDFVAKTEARAKTIENRTTSLSLDLEKTRQCAENCKEDIGELFDRADDFVERLTRTAEVLSEQVERSEKTDERLVALDEGQTALWKTHRETAEKDRKEFAERLTGVDVRNSLRLQELDRGLEKAKEDLSYRLDQNAEDLAEQTLEMAEWRERLSADLEKRIATLAGRIMENYAAAEEWRQGGPAYKEYAYVRHRGGLWQARAATHAEPGVEEAPWMLLVNGLRAPVVRYDERGDLEVGLRFTNGDVVTGTVSLPQGRDCGTFQKGREYEPGDLFRADGNSYRVLTPGPIEDPNATEACVVMALRGGRGARGKQGERGLQGDPVPIGEVLEALEKQQDLREGVPLRTHRGAWSYGTPYARGDQVTTDRTVWLAYADNDGTVSPQQANQEAWVLVVDAAVGALLSGVASDELVGVSENDTDPGYLQGKLQSADNSVIFTVYHEGADEKLDLQATGVGGGQSNVGANVGGATELYRDKTGVALNFRTVADTARVTAVAVGDVIELTVPDGVFEPEIGAKGTAFNKDFAGDGVADTVARSDHAHEGIYLKEVENDPSPVAGGDFLVGGPNEYAIGFTDAAGQPVGWAGYIDAVYEGVYLAHSPGGAFDPNDGALLLNAGLATLFAAEVNLSGLMHSDPAGYQDLKITASGAVFSAPPASAGWSEAATSAMTHDFGNDKSQGPWVQVAGLSIDPEADVADGDRLDITVILETENVEDKQGTLEVGFGINGASPGAGALSKSVSPGSQVSVVFSFSTTTHGGLSGTDTVDIFARRGASQDDAHLYLRGDLDLHEFLLSSPSGGGGGDPTNLGVVYGPSSFTITSSTGTNAPVANAVPGGNAGAFSGTDKLKLDGIVAGTAIGNYVVLEDVGGNAGLPAVDGSQLTGLPGSGVPSDALLDGYTETGVVVAYAATYAVPLDGRPRAMTLTGNISNLSAAAPVAPECGGCKISLIQDATGGRTVAYDSSWYWPEDGPVAMPSGPNEILTLMLDSTPDGRVEARGQVMSQ